MPEIVVIADTSCLIALSKIKALELLHSMYKKVIITKEIASEFGEPLPKWIIIKQVKEKKISTFSRKYIRCRRIFSNSLSIRNTKCFINS